MANERDPEAAFVEARERLAADDARARDNDRAQRAIEAAGQEQGHWRERAFETLRAVDPNADLREILTAEGYEYDHTPVQGSLAEACQVLAPESWTQDDYPATVGEFLDTAVDGKGWEQPDLDAYLDRLTGAQDAAGDGQPMTLEGIAAEPWDAVNRPIPADASPELLAAAREAAAQCVEEAHTAMTAVYDGAKFDTHARDLEAAGAAPDAHEYFEQHYLDALDRYEQLGGRDLGPEVQPPEPLTLEALERDPHNVLTHPIPDAADAAFLQRAAEACDKVFAEIAADFEAGRGDEDAVFAVESKAGEIEDMREALAELSAVDQVPGRTLDEADMTQPESWHEMVSHGAMTGQAPLDAVGVGAARQDARGKSDARSDPTREQRQPEPRYAPSPEAGAARPEDQFAAASRAALRTADDLRKRDLADVINILAEQTGAKDSPEHTAFRQTRADMADRITREADPANRADLRQERDRLTHAYAADLFDNVGSRALSLGDLEGAEDMHRLAEVHRELAGERGEPGGGDRAPDEVQQGGREQFANAAQAVGRAVSGPSAETVMVADGPEPKPDGHAARHRAALWHAIMPETVNDFGRQLRTAQHSAPHDARPHAEPFSGAPQDGAADRHRENISRRQAREEAALHGAADGKLDPMERLEARLAGHAAALEQEWTEGQAAEGPEGPDRESGQGVSRPIGHYASLGRV